MLDNNEISLVKGMLARGDKQHDIAAFFGTNGGRIAEIATGRRGSDVKPAGANLLPTVNHGPRFIDPNSSLQKQIEQLTLLLKNPPENSRRVKFTPKLAEYVLTNLNPHNRPRRSNSIARYADDMADNNWSLTGDTIKFSKSGILRDGQHRLAACLRAGVNFETYVVFGIDDSSFTVMDTGAKRSGSDVFTIAGVKNPKIAAGAIRWHLILTGDKPTDRAAAFDNNECLDHYRTLKQPIFDDAVSLGKEAFKLSKSLPDSAMAAIFYIFASKKKYDACQRFMADLAAMRGGAKKLITILDRIRQQNMGRVHENQRNAMVIRTLNKYAEGHSPVSADIHWNESMEFPEVLK